MNKNGVAVALSVARPSTTRERLKGITGILGHLARFAAAAPKEREVARAS